jgi:hypothetical protein
LPRISVDEIELGSSLRKLDVHTASGASGWTNASLRVLGFTDMFASAKAVSVVERLAAYAALYVNADLPPWYYWLSTGAREIALLKPGGGLRPIAVGCRLRAVVTGVAFGSAMRKRFAAALAPHQSAVGVEGGMSRVVLGLALHLEEDPDAVVINTDVENAFGKTERSAVVAALDAQPDPSVRALVRLAIAVLSPASPVVSNAAGARVLFSWRSLLGPQAGSKEGMLFFCIALAAVLSSLRLPPGVVVPAVADDIFLAGPGPSVVALLPPLAAALHSQLGLTLKTAKSVWHSHPAAAAAMVALRPPVPQGEVPSPVQGAPALVGGVCAGVPLGSSAFVRHQLDAKYDAIERSVLTVQTKLGAYPQHRLHMLLRSLQFLGDYWLQHCSPADTEAFARKLDALFAGVLSGIVGLDVARIPLGPQRVALPVREGGMGLTSRVDMRGPAFLGMVAKALPHLLDRVDQGTGLVVARGMFHTPTLAALIGSGSFGPQHYDFGPLVRSGCALGEVVRSEWPRLQALAAGQGVAAPGGGAAGSVAGAAAVPGGGAAGSGAGAAAPAVGALSADVSKIGQGISNLQHAILTALAAAAKAALLLALPPRSRLAALVRSQDRLSSAFFTVLPSSRYTASAAEFKEMLARFLGAPSPACAAVLGQPMVCSRSAGDGTFDAYGDNALSATSHGDWPRKYVHTPLVHLLTTAARDCGGYAVAEDASFFLSVIPAAAIAARRAQAARAGPGADLRTRTLVPDIVCHLGNGTQVVELKTISLCATWYPNYRPHGVEVRARAVRSEYGTKARQADRDFGLAAQGSVRGANATVGPVEAKLLSVAPVCAAVVGAFAEGSKDLHSLIEAIAASGGRKMCAQLGVPEGQAAASIRRLLTQRVGFVAARGIAQVVLARTALAAPITAQRGLRRVSQPSQQQVISLNAVRMAIQRSGGGGGGGGGAGGGGGDGGWRCWA